MDHTQSFDRRTFLQHTVLFPAAAVLNAPSIVAKQEEGGVSTNEDLMREHGVLKRVLLIYDDVAHKIVQHEPPSISVVKHSAAIIRDFIEKYHEKLEENYLFPRFRKANTLVELINVLETQHEAGRKVTARVIEANPKTASEWSALAIDLRSFVRMYSPHEAREDTVLFPALHKIVSKHEYDALGEQFETIERKTFGGDGFEMYVNKVTEIEKQLGIYELSQFTPR